MTTTHILETKVSEDSIKHEDSKPGQGTCADRVKYQVVYDKIRPVQGLAIRTTTATHVIQGTADPTTDERLFHSSIDRLAAMRMSAKAAVPHNA